MHSVYRTHRGNAQPTKKLIDLIKKTAKIRNTWLENANSKNIYSKMNLEGLNYISTKELQATFTAVFINYLVFLFSDRYRCLGPPVTAIFRKKTLNVAFSLFAFCFKNSALNQEQIGHQLSSV